SFDPSVDCTGSFSEAIAPDTIRVGSDVLYILYEGNGWAGGPYLGRYNLYHFGKDRFVRDLQVEGVSLHNWRVDWNSTFNFVPAGNNRYKLTIITTGSFDADVKADLEAYHTLPEVYDEILTQKDYSQFTLTRVYTYSGGKYELSNQKVDLYIQ